MFADDTNLHPKDTTMKLLELTDTFIKVEGYKVNIEYKKNKQIEREIEEKIPFTITLNENKARKRNSLE